MLIHHEGDLQFGSNPVGPRDEHWFFVFAGLEAEETAKASQVGQDLGAKRRSDKRLDAIDKLIACIDIHTCITIGRHELMSGRTMVKAGFGSITYARGRILTEGPTEVNASRSSSVPLFSCCHGNKSYTVIRIFPKFFERTSRRRRMWWPF